jgi:hypothetical protein
MMDAVLSLVDLAVEDDALGFVTSGDSATVARPRLEDNVSVVPSQASQALDIVAEEFRAGALSFQVSARPAARAWPCRCPLHSVAPPPVLRRLGSRGTTGVPRRAGDDGRPG